jgi:PPOX class probable F420-dependent enzyme
VPNPARTPRTALSATARALLAEPQFAVIATLDPDGSPLQAVVWYLVEGDSVVFNSAVGRRWPANLVRDTRIAFMVADQYRYVELCGRVEIDDDPERGYEVIATLARKYEKDPAELAAMLERFGTQQRVTFRLRPEAILEHFD